VFKFFPSHEDVYKKATGQIASGAAK